jgi:RNA polymerase sigma-70 factor (ECF subfamily)
VALATTARREEDLALAQRASSGDRLAQREVFTSHRTLVHRTLFRILGSNRELEDLIQDAFVEIFRSLGSFRGDSALGRWCAIIATRIAYLAISRRRPVTSHLELVDDVASADPDARQVVLAREAARRLYAALDHLEAKQRIAFALAVIDGLPLAEVAALTESSLLAVKTRVWRGRRELMARAARDPVLASYLDELTGGAGRTR